MYYKDLNEDFSNFRLEDLLDYMQIGHEIEFYFNGERFFIQPDYNYNKDHPFRTVDEIANSRYLFYHCKNFEGQNSKIILSGTYDEIFDYCLKDGYTLRNNFDKFSLHLIF